MAVAHSAASESHTGTTGSANQTAFSWTHTQTGTPQGVVVFVSTFSTTVSPVTSVTYGGVALTQLTGGIAQDGAGEQGRMDTFFLGSGLGTGNQTITVNRTSNATVMYASAATVTAGADTAVPTNTIVLLQGDGTLTVQSVNDTSPGVNSVRYAGAYSGLNAPPAAGTGSTLLNSIDIGNYGSALVRETTAGQGARNVGFSGAIDDRAAVHLAIRELVPRTETPFVGTFTLTGQPATFTKGRNVNADTGAFALTGNNAGLTVSRKVDANRGQFFLPERNLAKSSESFSFPWAISQINVTADATTAPDGTPTADALIETTSSSSKNVLTLTPYARSAVYTGSCYLKLYPGPSVRHALLRFTNLTLLVDLTALTVSVTSGTAITTGIADVGNGWYRAWATAAYTGPTTTGAFEIWLLTSTNSASYTGDGLSGLYAWGAQFEQSSLSDYDPTGPEAAGVTNTLHNIRLDGGTGTFNLIGNDATFTKTVQKVIEPVVGTFEFTGNPATFQLGRNLAANKGTFLLTGNQATLSDTDKLNAELGTFALVGSELTLRRGYVIAAEVGSFSLVGNAVTLARSWNVSAVRGQFTLTGGQPALLIGHYLSGGRGEFTETGQPVIFRRTWAIRPVTGTFTLTGIVPALTEIGAYEIDPFLGTFALTGQPAQLAQSQTLPVDAGGFSLTGNAADTRHNWCIEAATGIFALSGGSVVTAHNYSIRGDTGTFVFTGQPATLRHNLRIEAATGSFSLTGNPAALTEVNAYEIDPIVGTFAFTGQAAVLAKASSLLADTGVFSLTGNSATFSTVVAFELTADRGQFLFTGNPATLAKQAAAELAASAGAFAFTGNDVALKTARVISLQAGGFTLTGNSISINKTAKLLGATGAFTLNGSPISFTQTATRRRNVLIF